MDVSLSPRARTVVLWLGVAFGGIVLLEAAHALAPFVWAIITAYIFHPLVSFLQRKTRLPKHLVAFWLYLMVGLIVTIMVINIAPSFVDQVRSLRDDAPLAIDNMQSWIEDNQGDRLESLGVDPVTFREQMDTLGTEATDFISSHALPVLLGTFGIAIELFVFLVASFYFIVYGDRFVNAFRGALNRRYHREFDRLVHDINVTLGRYIRGQLLLVFIMSTASFVLLRTLRVDYALTVALATGFLELIPIVGPWSAGALAVGVSLFQGSTPFGWSHATLAIVIGLSYFVLRQLEDTFVIPMVIGRIVHLHPLLVIFVLVIGTTLGGILGLILAVPVAAVAKIFVSFFYAKLIARETRHIEVIAERDHLERLLEEFPSFTNATMVMLIEPESLHWNDLPLVRRVTEAALDHAIALSVVTNDSVAGALFTAAGVDTKTVGAGYPSAVPTA